jgi:acyl-CoA synthetase
VSSLSCADIEAVALRHGGIEQAAAFPVPDPRLGERVCLAVVPAGGATPDAGRILDHLAAEGVAPSDLPELILCLTEMPLTPSGKIVKRELMRWVAEGRVQPRPVRYERPASAAGG